MKKTSIILSVVIAAIVISIPIANLGASDSHAITTTTTTVSTTIAQPTTEATTKETTQQTTTEPTETTTVVTTTEPYEEKTMYIGVAAANVRKGPSLDSEVVDTYYIGEKITVIGEEGKWYKIGKNKWTAKTNTQKDKPVVTTTTTTTKEENNEKKSESFGEVELQYSAPYNITSNKLTRSKGVNYNGSKETWYSEKVLPGGGLNIPGRHVADDGTIRDKDGYLVVACDPSYKSQGTKIMTSLGPAIVRDTGCAYGVVDVYVSW